MLERVPAQARLGDLLAETTLVQTYRNREKVGIEAVYTFPLLLDAVLIGVEATLGERRLRSVVVARREAGSRT